MCGCSSALGGAVRDVSLVESPTQGGQQRPSPPQVKCSPPSAGKGGGWTHREMLPWGVVEASELLVPPEF